MIILHLHVHVRCIPRVITLITIFLPLHRHQLVWKGGWFQKNLLPLVSVVEQVAAYTKTNYLSQNLRYLRVDCILYSRIFWLQSFNSFPQNQILGTVVLYSMKHAKTVQVWVRYTVAVICCCTVKPLIMDSPSSGQLSAQLPWPEFLYKERNLPTQRQQSIQNNVL